MKNVFGAIIGVIVIAVVGMFVKAKLFGIKAGAESESATTCEGCESSSAE